MGIVVSLNICCGNQTHCHTHQIESTASYSNLWSAFKITPKLKIFFLLSPKFWYLLYEIRERQQNFRYFWSFFGVFLTVQPSPSKYFVCLQHGESNLLRPIHPLSGRALICHEHCSKKSLIIMGLISIEVWIAVGISNRAVSIKMCKRH